MVLPVSVVVPTGPSPEPGDLVGLAAGIDLAEDGPGVVVQDRQQVHGLPVSWRGGCPAAPCRLPPALPAGPRPGLQAGRLHTGGLPGAGRRIQDSCIDCFQDPADGGLIRTPEPPGPGIAADPGRGQDGRRRVSNPLADGGERLRPGHHSGDRGSQHRGQRMAHAPPPARVRHPRQVLQQAQVTARQQRTVTGRQISDLLQGRSDQR